MFYQACRVSGKNSTPCKERKEDGTVIIEIDLEPAKNWQVTCDCVGILKVMLGFTYWKTSLTYRIQVNCIGIGWKLSQRRYTCPNFASCVFGNCAKYINRQYWRLPYMPPVKIMYGKLSGKHQSSFRWKWSQVIKIVKYSVRNFELAFG